MWQYIRQNHCKYITWHLSKSNDGTRFINSQSGNIEWRIINPKTVRLEWEFHLHHSLLLGQHHSLNRLKMTWIPVTVIPLIDIQERIFLTILVSFPTPMEEQKKNLSCKYLGCTYVEKSSGIDILRLAIETLAITVPEDQWIPVIVNISPTSILVCADDVRDKHTQRYFHRICLGIQWTIDWLSNSLSVILGCWKGYEVIWMHSFKYSIGKLPLCFFLRLVFVDLLFIVQIILLNVMFSIVNPRVFNYVRISKRLVKWVKRGVVFSSIFFFFDSISYAIKNALMPIRNQSNRFRNPKFVLSFNRLFHGIRSDLFR